MGYTKRPFLKTVAEIILSLFVNSMKQILISFFIVACAAFSSCSGDDKYKGYINGFSPKTISIAKKKLLEAGLNPKEIDKVSYVFFIDDSMKTKYVSGVKDNSAWFAVFDSNGEESESYTFPNSGAPDYYSCPHRYEIYKDLLFITVSNENETSIANSDYLTMISPYCNNPTLYIVNRANKRISSSIDGEKGNIIFAGRENNMGYIIDQRLQDALTLTESKLHFVNKEGVIKWSRNFKEGESQIPYGVFFNEEDAIISGRDGEYRAVNMKSYTLKFIINQSDIPMTGELYGDNEVYYGGGEWIFESGRLLFVFSEYKREKVIDNPVTGDYYYKNIVLNKYAYEINQNDGSVLGFEKYTKK